MFHAHCVCVVGKNYRLQDIQLSKIIRGYAPNPGSVARGTQRPAPLPRSSLTFVRSRVAVRVHALLRADNLSKTFELHTSKFKLPVVVENTGLEPVTSWLQTRRSPS